MTTHLSTPANPTATACGATTGTRTFWRWKCDCATCKAATAAHMLDATTNQFVQFKQGIPIRFSKLLSFIRARSELPNVEEAIDEFMREQSRVGSLCPKCKARLPDPIALFDVEANRMVFACPPCSSEAMRARWESEA